MRKYYKELYYLPLIVLVTLFSGCSQLQSVTAMQMDLSLPKIKNVRHLVDRTSVGFEWPEIKDKRVAGVDVYRAVKSDTKEATYTKIATIGNRYATHFVDTSIVPNTTYLYMFRTFSTLYSSAPGEVVSIKTMPPLPPVNFAKAILVDSGVVKLLWPPHPNPVIYDYVIERRLKGDKWKYLATVKGRLSPEYIDMSAVRGRVYGYRVVARSADGIRAIPSNESTVEVH